jgi:hypothetical protein
VIKVTRRNNSLRLITPSLKSFTCSPTGHRVHTVYCGQYLTELFSDGDADSVGARAFDH